MPKPKRSFKVIDPYEAGSPDEGMSCRAGELIDEISNSDAADGDEFVLCRKPDGTEGYVPYDVLTEVSTKSQMPPPPMVKAPVIPPPVVAPKVVTAPPVIPPPVQPVQPVFQAPKQISAPVVQAPVQAPVLVKEPPKQQYNSVVTAEADSFKDLFEKHEQYFQQVSEKRDESFRKLADAIAHAQKEIQNCRERNGKIRGQIRELDDLIDQERKRWKERLEIEKQE
ncbi:Conserved_hypothetical protein [Hexamita inflata]|uniref:SH3 domain-containing protein n=1 Tax=Hexamita inflata TaxID=28002 RepID=A0AA86QXE3_9EUKA|nr:Conserved hypothetical protein [Hexamita inflata]